MTDQPLPLKPLMCAIHEKEKCFDCESTALWKLLAAKEAEIEELKKQFDTMATVAHDSDEARQDFEDKIQEQAETIRLLTEALEIVARRKCFDSVFIHGKGFTVCVCNEIGAKQALDRVRGEGD